GHYIAVTYKF
ncbi:hypothetical protein JV212_12390, partial [Vibrio parahaemolyticus]